MIFLIVNAVLSAIFFLVVVLPLLYIYNPDKYPGEANTPPSAGEVIPDEDITHAVKQKLYLLFIIPTCAAANAIFLYFAYYRPLRFIHYRVELNLLTLRLTLDAGRQQLQKSGMLSAPHRAGSMVPNFSVTMNSNSSMISRNYAKGPGRSLVFDGNESSRQKLASSVNWEWRRHARPKNVRRDTWVNSAVFAEISELRDEVEQHFLLESSVADANFAKAMKTVGAFLPATTSTMVLESAAQMSKSEAAQKNFYNSSRPPLMVLGARTGASERRSNKTNINSNNNDAANGDGVGMRGVPGEREPITPQRNDSVVMVPMESNHRRGGGNSSNMNNGNSRAGSALRLFRGRRKSAAGSRGSQTNSENRGEQMMTSPVRRGAFEPVEVGGMSPLEPPNEETAVRHTASRNGDVARGESDGTSPGRQSMWRRLWH
ncbi:hypothetical protein ABB37_06459 [Leptomonas pyrrhocoris]|uniref:Uncharacterized protein n=1 Tax=Leptomonas pyrrhocoris TaxID=157538 RepID=A0A0M9FY85_LEPPY|nr:hypothetical protein ABB37_06459 [Leptomonas pyrrhocoris]KPA78326.1 hypothetical protein ABB37_06459 [Leptomonas pyrrhocoris]|eukprot:XP_015656765.1 hypothetical protein ABB37_06459 [Leptomonas pyrrhocoris]